MASHNGRILTSVVLMAVLFGNSPIVCGQNRQVESEMYFSEGRSPRIGTFSVTLVRGHSAETSAGGVFSLHGRGLQLPPATLIFEDGFESGDTSQWSATVPEPTTMPSGAVMFFNVAVCPTGWSFLSTAQGRALVALRAGGTLGGTVLPQLSDLSSGVHNHTVNGSIDIDSGGQHSHWWAYLFSSERRWSSYTVDYGVTSLVTWGNGMGNEGSGVYPFTATLGGNRAFFTSSAGYHDHTLDFSEDSDLRSAILPYLQLLACVKD